MLFQQLDDDTGNNAKLTPEGGMNMILVAEDNEINQIVIEETLLQAGHEFKIFDDGQKLIDEFQSQGADLILMDVSMPGMNGLDASRAIRKLEETIGGHVVIIAVTAHALNGDREMCLEAGMDDYISKPLAPNDLDRMIESWLKESASPAMSA